MAKLTVKEILEAAATEIERHPQGLRFKELFQWFRVNHPEVPEGTLAAELAHVPETHPNRVFKPARGLYAPIPKDGSVAPQPPVAVVPAFKESDIYGPFAAFLAEELDEVTKVAALGGAYLRGKWATPDVVGTYRPEPMDLIKWQPEIVSAEIKKAGDQSVVAFGQAIAYRLFSHKSYIVAPASDEIADFGRLEALCQLFGIGLVVYQVVSGKPEFEIRARAQRVEPDVFFVNDFARLLYSAHPEVFKTLFA